MAFDIVLRDNGVGVFDITLGSNIIVGGETEKVITFLGLIISESSATAETSCVFIE
jgi:hypothetical protein